MILGDADPCKGRELEWFSKVAVRLDVVFQLRHPRCVRYLDGAAWRRQTASQKSSEAFLLKSHNLRPGILGLIAQMLHLQVQVNLGSLNLSYKRENCA